MLFYYNAQLPLHFSSPFTYTQKDDQARSEKQHNND